jgi:hypothetical protein
MDKLYDAEPVSAYAVLDMNSAVAVEATATVAPSAPPRYTMAMDRLDDLERPSAANFPKVAGAGPRTDQAGAVTWFRKQKGWMKKYVYVLFSACIACACLRSIHPLSPQTNPLPCPKISYALCSNDRRCN